MSVAVAFASTVQTVETIDSNAPAISSADNTLTHNGYNTSLSLNAGTTPPVTKCAYFSKALSSGSATIDLTALTGTNGVSVDGSGLKVQIAKFKNPASNGNNITVTVGASNGYLLAGAAWKAILAPGQEITFYGNDATPDIGGSAKTIDLSGAGTQALECSIIMG